MKTKLLLLLVWMGMTCPSAFSSEPLKKIPEIHVDSMLELAEKAGSRGEFREQMALLKEAYHKLEHSKEDGPEARVSLMLAMGDNCNHRSLPEKAFGFFAQALKIQREKGLKNPSFWVRTCSNLGLNLGMTGQSGIHKKLLDHSIEICKRFVGENSLEMADCYSNYCNYYSNFGDYEKTRLYIDQALEIVLALKGEKCIRVAQYYEDFAGMWVNLGNTDLALEYCKKSLKLRQELLGEKHVWLAYSYAYLALLYAQNADGQNAREALNRCSSILMESQANPLEIAQMSLAKASAEGLLGTFNPAVEELNIAKERFREVYGPRHPEYAKCLASLGAAYVNQFDLETGLKYFEKSIQALLVPKQIYSSQKGLNITSGLQLYAKDMLVRGLMNKALVYGYKFALGRDSLEWLDRSVEAALQASPILEELCFEMASEQGRRYQYRIAKNVFVGGLSSLFMMKKMGGKNFQPNKALFFTEKYKANQLLRSIQEAGVWNTLHLPKALSEQRSRLKSKLIRAEQKLIDFQMLGKGNPSKTKEAYFKVSLKMDSIQTVLKEQYPEYCKLTSQSIVATLEDIRQYILRGSDTTALIEVLWGDTDAIILGISSSDFKMTGFTIPPNFREDLTLVRAQLEGKASSGLTQGSFESALHNIYSKILQPLLEGQEALENATKLKELHIVLDGPLRGIPFEILLTEPVDSVVDKNNPAEMPWLLNRYSIGYGFSGSTLLANYRDRDHRHEPADYSILAFSPDFKSGTARPSYLPEQKFPSLVKGHALLEKLSETYHTRLFSGEEASEQNFKDFKGRAKVLHLNTHGFFHDSLPMHSGIIFHQEGDSSEDGVLYTRELFNQNLNCDLAILGACNTGFGVDVPGENLMSLSRGFAYAGCPALVNSLWEQKEGPTSRILERFYQELEKGKGKAAALRTAKLAYLRDTDAFGANPSFWACLVVSGNLAPIDLDVPAQKGLWVWLTGGTFLFLGISLTTFRRLRNKGGLQS